MPVAILEKRDEELSRESKNVPKLGGCVLATGRHPGAQLLHQLIDRRTGEPPVGLDGDEPLFALQKSKQRNDIRPMGGLELGGARGLAAGPLELRQKVSSQANLSIG